jgi:hypothetical protein
MAYRTFLKTLSALVFQSIFKLMFTGGGAGVIYEIEERMSYGLGKVYYC